MAASRWTRRHSVVAAALALVLAGGGIAAAVALQPRDMAGSAPTTSPSVSAPSPQPAPPTASPRARAPRPDPVDPLTGGRPDDSGVLAVKIENIAQARPQSGLDQADVVVVEEVEARLTRLIAVYHRSFPRRVGPVRSARNTDAQLLPVFGKPGLVYSGANRRVQRNLDRSSVRLIQRSTRDPRRAAPHNVFVDLRAIERSADLRAARPMGWTFARDDPAWARAATDATPAGRVGGDRMTFVRSGGSYVVRWNGKPYDGDGRAARTDNVVVMTVRTRPDGNADVNGVRSVKSETVGHGAVTVYRDGRRRSGTWHRSSKAGPLRLVDAGGDPISLRPGRTWVLLSR
jgi:DUF3048 family protein